MSRSRRSAHPPAVCNGLAVIAMFAAAETLSARSQQAAPAPQQPVFRSGAQVIEVDARVFDRTGRFVSGLTPDDFEILEDGVPQHVMALTLVGAPAVAAPGAEQAAAPQPAVGQTSNRKPATSNRHTWVFFFDLNHLRPGAGFERARAASAEFIGSRFSEGDLAGVIADSRFVNDRLTTVREELVAAVNGVKPRTDSRNRQFELMGEWPRFRDAAEAMQVARGERETINRAVMRACQDDPSLCEQAELHVRSKGSRLGSEIRRATMDTLMGLERLALGLARMEGPKTLVFLSDGFVSELLETTLRGVVGQLARAGARVYAIDVRGLDRGRGAGIIDQDSLDHETGGPPSFDDLADGVNSLAIDTGGMMIRNANDIGWALDRIAADTSRYYVIGYQPTNTAFDGEFRRIEVRVKRPGVRVRARRGYLALEPAKMLRPQPIKAPQPPSGSAARQP